MSSTSTSVVFVIYGIVLFALLAPNVMIQLPKKYSDTIRILIHGLLFCIALIISYFVWTILPSSPPPPPSAAASSLVMASSSSSIQAPTPVVVAIPPPTAPPPPPMSVANTNALQTTTSSSQVNPYAVSYPNASIPTKKSTLLSNSPMTSTPSPIPSTSSPIKSSDQ